MCAEASSRLLLSPGKFNAGDALTCGSTTGSPDIPLQELAGQVLFVRGFGTGGGRTVA